MPLSNRAGFLGVAALAGAGALAAEGAHHHPRSAEAVVVNAPPLGPSGWDKAGVLRCCDAQHDHKQIFQAETFGVNGHGDAVLFAKMQNSLNAFDQSMGMGKLGTIGVVMGSAVTLALDDAAWQRWNVGHVLALKDTHGDVVEHNTFDRSRGGDSAKDASGEGMRRRGASFFACHNTLVGLAGLLGGAAKADGAAVLADLHAHVLPGYTVVPAGVAMIQVAQERGWHVYPIIG